MVQRKSLISFFFEAIENYFEWSDFEHELYGKIFDSFEQDYPTPNLVMLVPWITKELFV
jgi:hypothetical protein